MCSEGMAEAIEMLFRVVGPVCPRNSVLDAVQVLNEWWDVGVVIWDEVQTCT